MGEDSGRHADEAQLAAQAHDAGDTLRRVSDLARVLGENPRGFTLDDLVGLADALQGWAICLAIASGDDVLLERLSCGVLRRAGLDQPDAASPVLRLVRDGH